MSNAKKFEELLCSDEELQEKMRAAAEAFSGDASDEQAVFEAVVAPLAAEAGLPFTFEELMALAAASQELSLDDLDEAAGGFCFGPGLGEGTNACSNEKTGATACAGVGVGFLWTS